MGKPVEEVTEGVGLRWQKICAAEEALPPYRAEVFTRVEELVRPFGVTVEMLPKLAVNGLESMLVFRIDGFGCQLHFNDHENNRRWKDRVAETLAVRALRALMLVMGERVLK